MFTLWRPHHFDEIGDFLNEKVICAINALDRGSLQIENLF